MCARLHHPRPQNRTGSDRSPPGGSPAGSWDGSCRPGRGACDGSRLSAALHGGPKPVRSRPPGRRASPWRDRPRPGRPEAPRASPPLPSRQVCAGSGLRGRPPSTGPSCGRAGTTARRPRRMCEYDGSCDAPRTLASAGCAGERPRWCLAPSKGLAPAGMGKETLRSQPSVRAVPISRLTARVRGAAVSGRRPSCVAQSCLRRRAEDPNPAKPFPEAHRQPSAGATCVRMVSMTWAL
ncbi:hypothetical protein LKMONMHP_2542 [Methylobacterium organophilum]|uniref:Uncharacterized protein n=1 Tax=Methylobacterium organophilum TaxID=410 RepID=A0ABQ4TBF1_METOR|nr:hypothetical protein LKMONMHP_2542 [Methylobacterium organophilum]